MCRFGSVAQLVESSRLLLDRSQVRFLPGPLKKGGRLPSAKADCCNETCSFEDLDGPCWGNVTVVDEQPVGDDDYQWVHACEGHAYYSSGGKYIPGSSNGKIAVSEAAHEGSTPSSGSMQDGTAACRSDH